MRRNSLVNQVKFLGQVDTFDYVAMFKHCMDNLLKNNMGTYLEMNEFYGSKEVLRNNY